MLLADTMAWVFAIIGLMLAFPALWLLCRGLWPNTVERTTVDCARGLLVPFLTGIPFAALTGLLMAFGSKAPGPFSFFCPMGALCLFALFASSGVAGLVTVIGQRLPSPADLNTPWRATIRGGIVLELAYLLPFLGWFFLLPGSLIVGAGCTVRAIVGNWRDKQKAKPVKPRTEKVTPDLPGRNSRSLTQ